jgi:hypothetical protein
MSIPRRTDGLVVHRAAMCSTEAGRLSRIRSLDGLASKLLRGSLQTKPSRDPLSVDKVVANIMQTFLVERQIGRFDFSEFEA